MFGFLRGLLGSIARGLMWTARQAVLLPVDLAEGLFTGLWRHICPPQPEAEESTADVLRQVAGMIAGREDKADVRASHEMPTPKPLSEARVRRSMETALRYTTALMHGERLPSLANVPAEMLHQLQRLTKADAESMHREIKGALGVEGPGWWDGPGHEVLAPGPEEAPALRYA